MAFKDYLAQGWHYVGVATTGMAMIDSWFNDWEQQQRRRERVQRRTDRADEPNVARRKLLRRRRRQQRMRDQRWR